MKRLSKKLLILCGLIAATFVGCRIAFPSGSWRYKITVEIETPEGIKSGYAVREAGTITQSGIPNPDLPKIRNWVRGEAVVIDLGQRGVLFALIDDRSYEEFFEAFPFKSFDNAKRIEHYNSLKIGSQVESSMEISRLVFFPELKKPSSAQIVSSDNISLIVGEEIKLKKIKIEISNEKITRKLDEILTTFVSSEEFQKWQKTLKYGDLLRMSYSDFRRGE